MDAHKKQQQDKVFETDFIDSQKSDPPFSHLLALSHIYIYIYTHLLTPMHLHSHTHMCTHTRITVHTHNIHCVPHLRAKELETKFCVNRNIFRKDLKELMEEIVPCRGSLTIAMTNNFINNRE